MRERVQRVRGLVLVLELVRAPHRQRRHGADVQQPELELEPESELEPEPWPHHERPACRTARHGICSQRGTAGHLC